jgi:hypothetical protein
MSDPIQDAVEAERELARLDRAFVAVRQKMLARIAESEPGQKAEREEAYFTLRAVHFARAEIVAVINSGRVALARTST